MEEKEIAKSTCEPACLGLQLRDKDILHLKGDIIFINTRLTDIANKADARAEETKKFTLEQIAELYRKIDEMKNRTIQNQYMLIITLLVQIIGIVLFLVKAGKI